MGNSFGSVFLRCGVDRGMHQQQMIEYRIEENRVLREQIGSKRMRFTDDQRRRLAARAKERGRKLLAEVATIVTPETLMAWHRKVIAQKYDGCSFPTPGRRPIAEEIVDLVVRMAKENSTWVNQTGLLGAYDFKLTWASDRLTPEAASRDQDAPTFFTAVQEQLGLRLVPSKAPVEVIVSDHIEKPSEN